MSDTRRYSIIEEPRDDAYLALIRFTGALSDSFALILRPDLERGPCCSLILRDLATDLLGRATVSRWPGTELLGRTAELYRYEATEHSLELLTKTARRLFDWRQPLLPEDLSMARADGTPVLTTITHEGDAFLDLTADEMARLTSRAPSLALVEDHQQPGPVTGFDS